MPKRNPSSTHFQAGWKSEFSWVEETRDPTCAFCTVCKKTFSVQSMGRTALVSHETGKKHKENLSNASKSVPLTMFLSAKQQQVHHQPVLPTPPQPEPAPVPSMSTQKDSLPVPSSSSQQEQPLSSVDVGKSSNTRLKNLDHFRLKDSVTEAETLWCLHTVMSHTSLRNAGDSVTLFARMFPDSSIAKDMKLQKSKISYSIAYGLAPYFSNHLRSSLKLCDYLVLGFDESFNRIARKQQMDVSLRFWDGAKNQVSSRYFTSIFMNHSKATDLHDAQKTALGSLGLEKIVQLSMDGPNVNWKLLRLMKADRAAIPDSRQLLDIGSCGLHIVHGAFKTGIQKTGWELQEFLRSLSNLFMESPARRGDFTEITGSTLFPMTFCSVRWIENASVSERAFKVLPDVRKYVDVVQKNPEYSEPQCSAFKKVAAALKDNLFPAKLAFFHSLATDFEPFLTEFQSDAPMVPFLYSALTQLLQNCLTRFVKEDVISSKELHRIDVMKKEDGLFVNLKRAADIDIGYETRSALRNCKGVTKKEILLFRQDCRTCLQFLVVKIMERSALKYPLTKALTFLDPATLASSNSLSACQRLTEALDIVLEANLFPATTIQSADREFRELISNEVVINQMKSFRRSETRLDDFWMQIFAEKPAAVALKKVVQLLLTLSHGNATLERGFSVNSDILVENLAEESLVAQRLVFDSIVVAGGLQSFSISKELLLSMRNAHSRYKEAEEERKKKMSQKNKQSAEKRRAEQLVLELQEKKRMLQKAKDEEIAAINEQLKGLQK